VSADLSELLVLRRLVLDTAFGVETARNTNHAVELLATHRYAAVIIDDALEADAEDLLRDVTLRSPHMLRVLLERDSTLIAPPETERIRRPYYAARLRAVLSELALEKVELSASDDTIRTTVHHDDGL